MKVHSVLNWASQYEDPNARVVVHLQEILPSEIDGDTVPFNYELNNIRIIVLISTCFPDVHIVCITGPKRNEQYNTILYNYHSRAKVCSFINSHQNTYIMNLNNLQQLQWLLMQRNDRALVRWVSQWLQTALPAPFNTPLILHSEWICVLRMVLPINTEHFPIHQTFWCLGDGDAIFFLTDKLNS